MTSDIQLSEIQSGDDALEMAACRNQVRTFMTHSQTEITPEQQLDWFKNTYTPARAHKEMFGYVLRKELEPIGYGLISYRNWLMWVSGGIVADQRGNGYGEALFDAMTNKIHGELDLAEAYLDVQANNSPARQLYEKLGYAAIGNQNGLVLMVHTRTQEAA